MKRSFPGEEEDILKITFNDEAFETQIGDNLLTLARRHGAHIWFLCDGRGLCQTCQCRVISGAENLSPATEIEVDAVSESRRQSGFRLACQTRLIHPGDASVISLAEQMRRRAVEFVTLQRGTASADDLKGLMSDLAGFASDLFGSLPNTARSALPQLVDSPPSAAGMYVYIRDAWLIIDRILAGPLSTSKK